MLRKPTLHDVASLARVSTRTVSRVVNNESGYSADTRARVEAAIEQLGYRPNLAARSLITNRTRTIGLVVTHLTDPFFPELADGVMRAARDRGYTMFLSSTEDHEPTQRDVLDSLASHGVEAAIVFPANGSDESLAEAANDGMPIVVIDHEMDHPNIGVVSSDIRRGAAMAVTHLIETGHRRIGMVASSRSPRSRRWREKGYEDAFGAAGHRVDQTMVARQPPTIAGGRAATATLLESNPDLTALFAYNDLMAIGAIAELKSLGRSVPDDVAVIGFDDIPLTEYVGPPITTVRLGRDRVGAAAVDLAIAMREDSEHRLEPIVIGVELVHRSSA